MESGVDFVLGLKVEHCDLALLFLRQRAAEPAQQNALAAAGGEANILPGRGAGGPPERA